MITIKDEHTIMISANMLLLVYTVFLYLAGLQFNTASTILLFVGIAAINAFCFLFNEKRDRNFILLGYLICGSLPLSALIIAGYNIEGIPVHQTIANLF